MTSDAAPVAAGTNPAASDRPGPSTSTHGATVPSGVGWKLASRTAGWTRPLAGRRFFPLWGVVRHRGRKSGAAYEIPVVIRGSGASMLIPLPWGPGTNWVRNVVAAGECVVVWKGAQRHMGHPEVVGPEAAAAGFDRFQRWAIRRLGIGAFLRLRPF